MDTTTRADELHTMDLKAFLAALAALTTQGYAWFEDDMGMLRATRPGEPDVAYATDTVYTTITALARHCGYGYYSPWDWDLAAMRLGLPLQVAGHITGAEDLDSHHDRALAQRLRAAVGLPTG